jgi:hypothetical protein
MEGVHKLKYNLKGVSFNHVTLESDLLQYSGVRGRGPQLWNPEELRFSHWSTRDFKCSYRNRGSSPLHPHTGDRSNIGRT